jgi:hypothetical protein
LFNFYKNFCLISRNLAASQPLKASFHGIRFAQVFSAARPIEKPEAYNGTVSSFLRAMWANMCAWRLCMK